MRYLKWLNLIPLIMFFIVDQLRGTLISRYGKMKIIELTPGYDLALANLIRFNLKKHHLAYADYIQGSRTFLEVSEDYRRV